jgi:hypothetical protein
MVLRGFLKCLYSGTIAGASAVPDLQYMGNQLLQIEAQKFIDQGMSELSKFLEKSGDLK